MNSQSDVINNKSTQYLVPINEIRNNVVVLKNSALRSIIEVDGINMDLLENEAQENLLNSWQSFLNNLDFSVQILVISRKTNIDEYLTNVEDRLSSVEEEMLLTQANDYINFVREFVNSNQIIDKKYYVVVPYDPVIFKKSAFGGQIKDLFFGIFNLNREAFSQDVILSENEFQKHYQQLILRQETVMAQLQRIGLNTKLVTTNEIIPLIHNMYNPDTAIKTTLPKDN